MPAGIRAEVKVDADGTCPVVQASATADAPVYSVTRSVSPDAPDRVTVEFMLEADDPEADVELSKVFDYGDKKVYRFSRELGRGCPCEAVETFDTPVVDIRTRDGMLYLVFHAAGMAELQEVIGSLQERYPTVDVQRLLRSEHDRPDDNLVFLDRGDLTDRQREVLETAHRMGYFEHPRTANAGEVADELDISRSTFSEHLAAAQSKLLDAILDS
ncbi:helix-turn-helix domain-containing protein [Natronomonas amylolytica]|uniref:helix-turn-helix domain-containing protein n=1 Tax=Natronomonas amylolytica TaxID=3108498 RepID=UPI00300B2BD9